MFPVKFETFFKHFKSVYKDMLDKDKSIVTGIIDTVLGGENIKDIYLISKNFEDWFRRNYNEIPIPIREIFI